MDCKDKITWIEEAGNVDIDFSKIKRAFIIDDEGNTTPIKPTMDFIPEHPVEVTIPKAKKSKFLEAYHQAPIVVFDGKDWNEIQ